MAQKLLLIDGNNLGHYYNNSKPLTIGSLKVQAIYNFLKGIRQFVALFQTHKPIVIWDGASWRRMMFAEYKENRERRETKSEIRLAKLKDEYKLQVPYIKKALRMLGIAQVSALNMEADDLGAILTDRCIANGGSVVLLTGDKDWLQLVGPGVVWRDPIHDRVVTEKNFKDFTGLDTTRQFVEMKALAGDSGDNVPGVGGIGEKGAIEFLNKYGSFTNFTNGVLFEKTIDFDTLPKKFKALVEDEEKAIIFSRNIDLVDLRTPRRPIPLNLQIDHGEPDATKFQRFCEILLFNSITKNLSDWLAVFPAFREPLHAAA